MRYLTYTLGDPTIEFPPPTEELMTEMGNFIEEAAKAGVLVVTGGVGPTAEATRVAYDGNEFTVVDGPFTEAKELIGGWAVLECRDKAEVIEWTKRFLALVGGGETTIRPVYS